MLTVGFYQLFKFLATHFGHFRDPTTFAFFYDVISKMTAIERVENGRPFWKLRHRKKKPPLWDFKNDRNVLLWP